MRFKCYEVRHFKCDKCENYKKHIDMHDDKICYDCWDEEQMNEIEND